VKILDAIPCSRAAEPHGQSESRDKEPPPHDLGARYEHFSGILSEFWALIVLCSNLLAELGAEIAWMGAKAPNNVYG